MPTTPPDLERLRARRHPHRSATHWGTRLALAASLLVSTACWTLSESDGPRQSGNEESVAATSMDHAERVRIGGVQWYVDYEAALAVAREQDKALWVHFGENPG